MTVTDIEDAPPYTDNICNEIKNGQQDVVTVKCDYDNIRAPRRGRYVTIRRKDDASERHLLNVCEVEVMSCYPGEYFHSSFFAKLPNLVLFVFFQNRDFFCTLRGF